MKNPFKYKDPFDEEKSIEVEVIREPTAPRNPWKKAPDIEEVQGLFRSIWDDYGFHVKRILFGIVGFAVVILGFSLIVMNPGRALGLLVLTIVGIMIYGLGSIVEGWWSDR